MPGRPKITMVSNLKSLRERLSHSCAEGPREGKAQTTKKKPRFSPAQALRPENKGLNCAAKVPGPY